MTDLFTFPTSNIETRWASPENPRGELAAAGTANGGRKGRPSLPFPAGATIPLAEEPAGVAGTIRRIWLTIDNRSPEALRGVRVDFYWDGAETPAVSAPLGDFFGVGLGRTAAFESALFGNPEGKSFNCRVPMAFRSGMQLTITNETDSDIAMLFYDVDYTVGDPHGPETLYLHTCWRRENPTTLQRDYEFLPSVSGRGRFLGVNFGVIANTETYGRTWWGEGEVKFYLDGDADLPTLCGTGTEDYIGTGWGQGAYGQLYQGCPVADGEKLAYAFYRWHIPDPLWFRTSIRGTIQQIGHCFGKAVPELIAGDKTIYRAGPGLVRLGPEAENEPGLLFERQDDWSSCAYVYLDRPERTFAALAPLTERIAGLS